MPHPVKSSLIDLRDLLELLRRHPLPTPFHLALYSERQGRDGLRDAVHAICPTIDGRRLCGRECLQQWDDLVSLALLSDRPQVLRCAQGFLGFAIPLPGNGALPDCLLGGGVRELAEAAAPIVSSGEEATPTMAQFPATTREQARRILEEISRLLPQLLDERLHDLSLARVTERLSATREIARELAGTRSPGEAVKLVSETLVVLFNLARVLVILRRNGERPAIHTSLGIDAGSFEINDQRLAELLDQRDGRPAVLAEADLARVFPGLACRSAQIFPLQDSGRCQGLIALLDVDLHLRDQALIELLAGRLASRLLSLLHQEDQHQERLSTSRLVTMIGKLALAGNRKELYRQLMAMSAELVEASTGSLMLLDEHTQTLGITVAKGMSPALARTMSVPLGEGIAGRVARSGFPLLVNDIEHDSRMAATNRPRFRTKSFISLPLKVADRLIGVLNLADKESGESFTETDLKLVQQFAGQAVQLIDRTAMLERAGQLEKLSVTDHLTGLYNRRFLETRLDEERNRSQRQGLSFCVIFADLDNFKLYNDICGHLAGDKALCKVAALMRRCAREMDLVVRYGGEEFCLILPGTAKRESLFVAERLRRSIEAEAFPGESNLPLGRLTVSLGVAAYPEDGSTPQELIHAADLALYRAKDQGRNRTVLYDRQFARNHPAHLRVHEGN